MAEKKKTPSTLLAPIGMDQLRLGDSRRIPSRSRSHSPASILSIDDFHELRFASDASDITAIHGTSFASSSSPQPLHQTRPSTAKQVRIATPDVSSSTRKKSWRIRIKDFWNRNYGLMLVLIAQFFATTMNVTTGLLEDNSEGQGMHPFQILFARMSITVLCSVAFMWWAQIPDWPFGTKDVRWLLVLRGVGGFFGVFGLYWSLQYLPLSDATVITFLSPTLACWACSKFIAEPFTRTEMYGGIVSLAGVILIARPTYLFSPSTGDDDSATPTTSAGGVEPTPTQHLAAIGMAIVGVFGAASAYTTIRIIGHRAHPLISVTYFSFWCTLVSTVALVFVPSIPFILPSTAYQWMLLVFIGLSGFIMQFLLTAGLRAEKSGRATNMLYLQMLFAIAAEKIIWGTSPGLWSLAGSTLILGAAGMVAMQKPVAAPSKQATSTETARAAPNPARTADAPRDEEEEEEEATGMLLHDAELHQLDDGSDIEMEEKRGRSTSSIEHDKETLRQSIEHENLDNRNTHLEPREWNFMNARRQREAASRSESEDLSPHTPELHRKAPVFWGK